MKSTPDGESDADAIRPYLDLAREIHAEVTRAAADPTADGESLVRAIESVPERERARMVRAVFDLLPPDQQWSIIERAFGDEAIRSYLADEREARLDQARRADRHRAVVTRSRAERRLDLEALPPGEEITLGLFRQADVRAALTRGHRSNSCARELVLRTTAVVGTLRVVDDVFDPRAAMFVTAEYNERVWRTERLASHTAVRVGSIAVTAAGEVLEPVVYPAARVDVEVGAELRVGRLHLGFAMVGDEEAFLA